MTGYKIKRYWKKKTRKGNYAIYAAVFKYRFGFLVDIFDEKLDHDYKCDHESKGSFWRRCHNQLPLTKKEANVTVRLLNKKLK